MIPRSEHPRPQFYRENWMNLNGEWQFCIDNGNSGRARKLYEADELESKIIVPFCPESRLSGVEHTDFMAAVWYKRNIDLPDNWRNGRVILHFGAVDYDTEVWINGVSAGKHRGGYTSFSFDITHLLKDGKNSVAVCAEDDTRSLLQPAGKQSKQYHSYSCMYTRTTGIWQTVWIEFVPSSYISDIKLTPNTEAKYVRINAKIFNPKPDMELYAEAKINGKIAGTASAKVVGSNAELILNIKPDMAIEWEPGNPALYNLNLRLNNDTIVDEAASYFGLRSIAISDRAVLINGKPLFQRLILDQGFYPDGIYTAPTDEALRKDIELSMALGFNGARLHQKVFEERFLYWADKLGYLVWGEMASWGLQLENPSALERFQTEWLEVLERDYNHPSIIGWCPFNETYKEQNPELLRQIYRVTKQIDPSRPCIDTSGYIHEGLTDIYDVHDYEQDPKLFDQHYKNRFPSQNEISADINIPCKPLPVIPYFVSEYGGIWWNPGQTDEKSWGYGLRPNSEEEFIQRYEELTKVLIDNPNMFAFCYTQLTNVEQEVNGLYAYDRSPKLSEAAYQRIKQANTRQAAIEKE
jgi:beta-galactosidase/beta-glucuronidase